MTSVWVAIIFGIVGYILPKYGYPVIPMLLAIILGPMAESSFRQALIMSDNSLIIFMQRPIALIFLSLAVISFLLPVYQSRKKVSISEQKQVS